MSDSITTSRKPPSPPPLPPLPPSRPKVESPSPFLAKLESAPADWLSRPVEISKLAPYRYEPTYYFFYGTLTQPHILKGVLDLKSDPELRPAKVIGYSVSSWGQYKALIDGKTGEEVSGYAFQVQSTEQEFKLARYETSSYRPAPCWIYFTDGTEHARVAGYTFKYAGDAQALNDGRFDRTLWEMQMGMRLPPTWRKKVGEELGSRD
ncbi:poly polymerase [Diplogelasinospora grovesii]|uniref:Putative gamma-glutamylcyclotransferase n=1 Tax=Diplogelasinospora grovesii TaxID=303347 RepID=A0AAN6N5C4_9PEZI|nr:poly polymerase [Diplogelasinospora grovesii]